MQLKAVFSALVLVLTNVAAESLQLTAIVGRDMKSRLECWTLTHEFANVQGMKIQQLGDLEGVTYTEMPTDQEFDFGAHNPSNQFFIILEGKVTVAFPTSDDVLELDPLRLYAATDTAETSAQGHITITSPGTRFMQFPFKDGVVPPHSSTQGPCGAAQVVHDEL